MDVSMDRARSFLLMTYHDLPNVLFIGSLFFGILSGYIPLIWVGLGLALNWSAIWIVQQIFELLFSQDSTQAFRSKSLNCGYGFQINQSLLGSFMPQGKEVVAPSFWMGSAFFFSIFCIYNSIRVMVRPASANANQDMKDNRKAYTISTLVIGLVFLCLIFLRAFTGCETLFGGITSFVLSGGLAIGFWHLLDACGTGRIPDILQVVGSMAPNSSGDTVPVVCSAEGFENNDTRESACQKYGKLVSEFVEFSEEFSRKSPDNPQHAAAFQTRNKEMAKKFSGFKKAFANKLGLGPKPNETCLKENQRVYSSFVEAQQKMEDAGWTLGV